MLIYRHYIILIALMLSGAVPAFAQPANDGCETATPITNVLNWCSTAGQFTNVNATPSGYDPAGCFTGAGNDVWFSFIAQATDITFTVNGDNSTNSGTLVRPQVALYYGSCGGIISELNCGTSNSDNSAQFTEAGLFVGAKYWIRVQGANNNTGTFQVCVNNYNPPVLPTADCPEASILCDKSSFVVQQITGAGSNIKELDDALCFSNGNPGNNLESNSTWYTWTCAQSGSLTFILTPLKADDDIDFAIYRLPNGIGNCANKELVRCNAAGDPSTIYATSPCMRQTGLKEGDPDASEDAGCDSGDDAWIAPLNMVAGETYVLCVNNYSASGLGFSIEFGGTGTFVGPDAKFTTVPSAICLGTPVQVVDASTFSVGTITSRKWSFGFDATPQTSTTTGPHTVTFSEPGLHPIVLTLETNLGCKVTSIQNVMVFPDVEVDTVIAEPECNGGTNGVITITNIKMGTAPYQYSWNNAPFSSQNSLTGIGEGTYSLVIRDANNCETQLEIPVNELTLKVNPTVMPPLCFGDDNGVVTLNVTNGNAPYQFDWGNGFIPDATQGGFSAGVYTIQGLDATLCKGTFSVTVVDNPVLTTTIDTINISCFGYNDGASEVFPVGGVGNYQYIWSDGQTTKKATGFGPGRYSVTITDSNDCAVSATTFIIEPADVSVDLIDVVDLVCNGLPEGEIRVQGLGGVQPYMFSATGNNYGMSDTLTGLLAGDYFVKIKDGEGCIDSVAATISQPPALIVDAFPGDTSIELGFNFNISTTTAPLGRPVEYLWTPELGLSCVNCPDPEVQAITSQIYKIQIKDSTGCVAYDSVTVKVIKNRPIFAPNVFAPQSPFPNDHFTLFGGPAAGGITLLRIYDRWGELVFETKDIELNNPSQGWDGTYKGKLSSGVFTYYAYIRFIDEEEVEFKGNVTVVR